MEQIIIFPLPHTDYLEISPALETGFSVCYQYGVDAFGFGPYGFNTEKAEEFLARLLGKVIYWNPKSETFIERPIIRRKGLYFSEGNSEYAFQKNALLKYKMQQKKKELQGKKFSDAPLDRPTILSCVSDRELKTSYIEHLQKSKELFFMHTFFTPQAGDTLLFFDGNLLKRINRIAEDLEIPILMLKSENLLKDW